jgi:hypothetical protein
MNPSVAAASWAIFIRPAFQVRSLWIYKPHPFTHEEVLSYGFS